MSTYNTLLTLGALVILTTSILNFNKGISLNDDLLSQNRYRMEALGILKTHLYEASQMFFDEATLDTSAGKTITDFAASAALGLDIDDAGVIDDFDDYHNMSIVDSGETSIPYQVVFSVEYVRLSGGIFVPSTSPTYHKRMRVQVYDNGARPFIYRFVGGVSVRDTLTMDYVHSYWFYN